LIDNDIIYVKGEENYLNITNKTIKSIDYLLNKMNKKYNYILRTNMSTFCNLKNIYKKILKMPKKNVYTGGSINNLQWLHPEFGIKDKKYFGLLYSSGTSIIISSDVAKKIIKNKNKIDHNIIDDVTLGIIIKNISKKAYKNIKNYNFDFVMENEDYLNKIKENKINLNKLPDFVRTRINNNYNYELFEILSNKINFN
jgi:hypothetical protein